MTRFSKKTESVSACAAAASDVRVAAERVHSMLAYSALFGSALSGYAGLGLWAAALVAAVLVAVSQIQYGGIYKRAAETGYLDMAQSTLLQSFGNAIVASGVCYAGGWLFRLL